LVKVTNYHFTGWLSPGERIFVVFRSLPNFHFRTDNFWVQPGFVCGIKLH